MILYFSGTGNSEFVAKEMGDKLKEKVLKITDESPLTLEFEGDSLGFVFPVYSWGVPPLMISYIKSLSDKFIQSVGNIPIWMVCVCGDETALAPEMLKKTLSKKGLNLTGGWSVIMPNNYVILPGFDVDSKDIESEKLSKAPSEITKIADKIKGGEWEEQYVRGSMPSLKTKLVYPLFKRWGIFPSKWYASDECISCGKCLKVCPMNNVEMNGSRPKWGKNCVSCLACYHICPKHAVQYGKATKRKGQYFYPNRRIRATEVASPNESRR